MWYFDVLFHVPKFHSGFSIDVRVVNFTSGWGAMSQIFQTPTLSDSCPVCSLKSIVVPARMAACYRLLNMNSTNKGVEFSRDAIGTCPYQYPATTKLSLAISLIKQLNIYVCNHCCCNFGPSEIGHTTDITWEVQENMLENSTPSRTHI